MAWKGLIRKAGDYIWFFYRLIQTKQITYSLLKTKIQVGYEIQD